MNLSRSVVRLLVISLVILTACSPPEQTEPPQPETLISVPVTVSETMRTEPFDVMRRLEVPTGFSIEVFARVDGARFLAVTPAGDLLVSQPSQNKVVLLRGGEQYDYLTDLRLAHDMVFHDLDGATYLYVASSNQINRYTYDPAATTAGEPEVVISGLPDGSNTELKGSYGHQLKNIALSGNDLYVSIASACNACLEDTQSDPVRGAIYLYDADITGAGGSGGELFAEGLRNAEGLDFLPTKANELWVTVNNRDNLPYPLHNDFDGDGSDDYGEVIQGYVDNHPPDEFTKVERGGNYGWPFCNPNPDTQSGYDLMPFDREVVLNPNGEQLNCESATRIDKGIQAHSAPLGFLFLHDTAFPEPYRQGAAFAYHGSWNRTEKTGYKVAHFPFAEGRPGEEVDLVRGWLDEASQMSWGRPVDVAVDASGAMYGLFRMTQVGRFTNLANRSERFVSYIRSFAARGKRSCI